MQCLIFLYWFQKYFKAEYFESFNAYNYTEKKIQYIFDTFTSFLKTFCQICSLKTVMMLLFGLFSDMAFFTLVHSKESLILASLETKR